MDNRPLNELSEIDDVRKNWGTFLALGILLIALGLSVIGTSYYATIFSMILLGVFLVGGGIIQIVQAFMARKWKGLLLPLLLGVLYAVTGVFCILRPQAAAVSITLWISIFCFIAGLFKMLASLLLRFDHWGWVFFNGLVTFALGAMIYSDWPVSGLWVIGLFIGIDLLLSGWSWVLLALTARLKY